MLRTLVATGSAMLLGVAVLVPTGLPASASPDREDVEQRQDEVQQGLEQSREDREHVSAELVGASERLEELEGQLPGARQVVAGAESEVAAARERDAQLAAELELAEGAVVAAGLQLDERTSQADETEAVVAGVAREVYQGSGFTPLSIMVEAESAREYADMVTFAAVAQRSQEQALSRLRVQQSDILNAEARLVAERARLDELKAQAAEQVEATRAAEQVARDAQAQLQTLVSQEDQAVAAFASAVAAEEAQIQELEQQSAALEAQLAAIAEAERQAELERQAEAERQREAEAAAAAEAQADDERRREGATRSSRPAPAPVPAPERAPAPEPDPPSNPSGGGYLSYPVNGRISSQFGYRTHPILGYRKLHAGTDIAAACGTPVKAAADGTIVSAGWGGAYGNLVVISHGTVGGESLATAYAHLSGYGQRSGSVSRGDVIGYVGTTGASTGCHVHFETREAGRAVDPMNYL